MTSNNDCYFYYYSTCTKGDACPFRHEPLALTQEVVCTFWKQGKCTKPHCMFRHLDVTDKRRNVTPCFFESQPGGCRKPHCPFLHDRPKEPYSGEGTELLDAAAANKTIIVNKNKIEELSGIVLPAKEGPKPAEEDEATRRRVSAIRRIGPKVKEGMSVKDRLGFKGEGEEENVEVFEYSEDSEEEELRASAIRTLDLRKRLSANRRSDDQEEVQEGKDERFKEEFRRGHLMSLEVVSKAKKKEKKEKKSKKKKEKKEKKSKKNKEGKALREINDQNESAETEAHRRIVKRVESPEGDEAVEGQKTDEPSMSLADWVAAKRESQFAATGDKKVVVGHVTRREGRLGSPTASKEEARKSRKRVKKKEEEEEKDAEVKAKVRKAKKHKSELPAPGGGDGREENSRTSSRPAEQDDQTEEKEETPVMADVAAKKDMIEVERFLKENPEVNAAANSSMDVMKELDELLQD